MVGAAESVIFLPIGEAWGVSGILTTPFPLVSLNRPVRPSCEVLGHTLCFGFLSDPARNLFGVRGSAEIELSGLEWFVQRGAFISSDIIRQNRRFRHGLFLNIP